VTSSWNTDERFAWDVLRANSIVRGEAMIAGQNDDKRLFGQKPECQTRHLVFAPEESHIEFA